MTGTATEIAFHMLPCMMHVYAAPLIGKIFDAPNLVRKRNIIGLTVLLQDISDMINRCRQVFSLKNEQTSLILRYLTLKII